MAIILYVRCLLLPTKSNLIPRSGQTTAWAGLIRVDNQTFTWLGAPGVPELANQTAYEYTSSKSIFTIDVNDKVTIKASFISPLTPKDLKRQSLVASYLNVEVSSKDGADHDVQLYTDISAGMWSPQSNPATRFRAEATLGRATLHRLYGNRWSLWYCVWNMH